MKSRLVPFLAFFYAAPALAGCVNVEIVPSQFPYEAMLSTGELGAGWNEELRAFPNVDGAVASHTLTFRHGKVNDPIQPAIVHQLAVYSDARAAQEGFSAWREQYVLGQPSQQPLIISPREDGDLTASRCENLSVNGQPRTACFWIQQHGNMTWYLQAFIDGNALTLDEFKNLILHVEGKVHDLGVSQLSA